VEFQKGGSWFSYKDTRLGQGRENSKVYLKDNPDIALEIENLIRRKYNLPLTKEVVVEKPKESIVSAI
jgi:recombination protein RecA